MQLVDLVCGIVPVRYLLDLLLRWYLIVLVVELNEVRIAFLDFSNIDLLLVTVLRPLLDV